MFALIVPTRRRQMEIKMEGYGEKYTELNDQRKTRAKRKYLKDSVSCKRMFISFLNNKREWMD